jgi:hypothetical protein
MQGISDGNWSSAQPRGYTLFSAGSCNPAAAHQLSLMRLPIRPCGTGRFGSCSELQSRLTPLGASLLFEGLCNEFALKAGAT